MDWRERIVVSQEILAGKPIIKGTRLAVQFIVSLLVQGWTKEDLLRNYPGLTEEDIEACLAYTSEVLKDAEVYGLYGSRR